MNKQFICATLKRNSFEDRVPAPYLRRSFTLPQKPDRAELSICGLGFYVLFVNGKNLTKGMLAPYISNPDHFCYYDTYDLTPHLHAGENVIGVLLGNGFMNPFGGDVWDFDKVAWIGVPRLALELCAECGEETVTLIADEQFRTHPSPILFDEMRSGEVYDARLELEGWNDCGFDDRDWKAAIPCDAPRGELRLCTAEPIRVREEVRPVSITRDGDKYIYDFGVNTAGVCRLSIKGNAGQTVRLTHFEIPTKDGKLQNRNLCFDLEQYPHYTEFNQTAIYTARGNGVEEWEPLFTYFGFRYVQVEGITEEQATKDLLTMRIAHSEVPSIGGFSCSDERMNRLFQMARNADLSNLYYFPTDCPHREKNGWTGDASMSSDHYALYYGVDKSWREWLANIRAVQRADGALPGIIPTGGWGFHWGNGPVFDSVLFNLPYMLYRFRGDTEVIRENAHAMVRYLEYALTKRNADGTVTFGLGDWSPVGRNWGQYTHPVGLNNTVMIMDVAKKAAEMLQAIGYRHQAAFARGIYRDMRETVRRVYLDPETCLLGEASLTAQGLGLYYGVFEPSEEPRAHAEMVRLIHENNDNIAGGFVSMHCIFHALSMYGADELAYKMITKPEYPSYGFWLDHGETALPEAFQGEERQYAISHNHHFMGDFIRWFMCSVAGLRILSHNRVEIKPAFLSALDHAEAYHDLPLGRVSVRWERTDKGLSVSVTVPRGVTCKLSLPTDVACKVKKV